jgi:hypothetical protein
MWGVIMEENKNFKGKMKKDVKDYIDNLESENRKKISEKEKIITALKNENSGLLEKVSRLEVIENTLNEEKSKISEVLVDAKGQARAIIDEARVKAIEEKKSLEDKIEAEKEKLVDIRFEIKNLREEVVATIKKYDNEMNELLVRAEKADTDNKVKREEEVFNLDNN